MVHAGRALPVMLPAIGYRIPVVAASIGIAAMSLWNSRSSEPPAPIIIVAPVLPTPRSAIATRAMPCVGDDVELLARGSAAVLCSSAGCLSVDMVFGVVTPTTKPVTVPIIRPGVRDGSICNARSCKHLGPKLAAAVAGATATEIDATAELDAVIITRDRDGRPDYDGALLGRSTAWNVAADRPFHIWQGRNADTGDIGVVGNFLVVTSVHHEEGSWRSTALYDARGGFTTPDLDGDPAVGSVDDSLVVAGAHGHIALIDATTGKITSQTSVATQPVWADYPSLVMLPDEHVSGFAVLRKSSLVKVVGLSTYSIVGGYLLADIDQQFPICAP